MNDSITQKQAISVMSLFIIGSSIVLGISKYSKQDAWIAFLMACVLWIPFFLMYGRILKLHPGQDFYDIIMTSLGRFGGTLLTLFFSLYALYLGALVMRDFSEFIQIISLTNTPQLPVLIVMLLLSIWVVKSGVETLGRWSMVTLPIMIILVIITFLFSLRIMNPSNFLPLMEHPFNSIAMDAFSTFTFPLAETVVFLGCLGSLRRDASPYQVFGWATMIASTVILVGAFFRNTAILGFPMEGAFYFPSYEAVSIVSIGSFLTRIEGIVSSNLIIGGFVKISVCLLSASRGIAKVFRVENYRVLVIPLALLMMANASTTYQNIMELVAWLDVYKYFVLPFQVIIPLLVFIIVEIKHRKKKSQQTKTIPVAEKTH